jgi:alkylated DNA nucleotide flippase Atl1
MKMDSDEKKSGKLKWALTQIHLRAQVQVGRTLTHDDLADLAGVGKRSVGDWMRGVSAPSGMSAVFELLSQLGDDDVINVVRGWRTASTSGSTKNRDSDSAKHQVGRAKAVHSRKTAIKKSTTIHRGK